MAAPSHLRCVVQMSDASGSGNPTIILYYKGGVNNIDTIVKIRAAANAVFTKIQAALCAAMVSTCSLVNVTAKVVDDTDDFEAVSNSEEELGVITSTIIEPEEVAVVIQKRTLKAGRNKRGRWFIPLVPDLFLTRDSKLTTDALEIYAALANKLREDLTISGVTGTFKAAHFDRKLNVMEDILETRVVTDVCSRRDRRRPKALLTISTNV